MDVQELSTVSPDMIACGDGMLVLFWLGVAELTEYSRPLLDRLKWVADRSGEPLGFVKSVSWKGGAHEDSPD